MNRKTDDLTMEELLRALCELSPGDWNLVRLWMESELQGECAALIAAARAGAAKPEDIIRNLAEILRRR